MFNYPFKEYYYYPFYYTQYGPEETKKNENHYVITGHKMVFDKKNLMKNFLWQDWEK